MEYLIANGEHITLIQVFNTMHKCKLIKRTSNTNISRKPFFFNHNTFNYTSFSTTFQLQFFY